jgi:hypothetical protein
MVVLKVVLKADPKAATSADQMAVRKAAPRAVGMAVL